MESTKLCNIMKDHGSDKGDDWHNYTQIYTILFHNNKEQIKNLFELGIGSTNTKIKSHMKNSYSPGGSLRGWREYFPKANIFAADIDKDILDNEERIKKFFVDQTDKDIIFSMWKSTEMPESFDIIIDDGLHDFEANNVFFTSSIHKLAENGIYIIEDIPKSQSNQFVTELGKKATEMGYYSKLLKIKHNTNNVDNIMMCITRMSSPYQKKIQDIPGDLLNE